MADTHPGVILVHLVPVVPYAVLILAGTFANYDVDYEDQACVLGASFWQVVWRVMLPAIRPGIVVGALFSFLISWGQYLLTLLIGGGNVLTLPMLLLAFANCSDKVCVAPQGSRRIVPAAGGRFTTYASEYHFDVMAEAGAVARFQVNCTVHLHFPADRLWLLPPESSHAS